MTLLTCPNQDPFCAKRVPADKKEKDKIYLEYNDIRMQFCSLACLELFKIERRKTKSEHATICDLCSTLIPKGAEVAALQISGQIFDNCCSHCAAANASSFVSKDELDIAKPATPKAKASIEDSALGQWLKEAVERKASDIFISVDDAPTLRVSDRFQRIGTTKLSLEQMEEVITQVCSPSQLELYKSGKEVDLALDLKGVSRFRVNIFRERGGPSFAIRPLPYDIPNLSSLGLPPVIEELTHLKSGLVLVTGATGSGKSTTLAAFVDEINRRDDKHIITVEDPVEFIIPNQKSLIHQREISEHTKSFSDGLRAALRENPDIIVVGELRDLESISLALRAAETGHLVLGTLHSGRAIQAITRLIDVFDSARHSQIRVQLAQSLQAICAQHLIRRKDGKGMAVATEVMIATLAIRNIIRENRMKEIQGYIQMGMREHMHSLEQSLQLLIDDGIIDETEMQKLGSELNKPLSEQEKRYRV